MNTEYLGQDTDFILGQDFLTWLWYKSETTQGSFETQKGEFFSVVMEQRISVQGGQGDSLETATVSGAMSELREARMGLNNGKKVSRALLRLERDTDNWQVSLKAENFSLNALKLPKLDKPEADEDPDAALLERLYLIDTCLELLDELYKMFLNLRLTSEWDDEVKKVREWMETVAD